MLYIVMMLKPDYFLLVLGSSILTIHKEKMKPQ